ncbi:MAG: hypothetical protein WBD46_01555 [Acidobacteriaceae bacterium]
MRILLIGGNGSIGRYLVDAFREPVTPDEAIRRTIRWQQDHPPAIPPASFDYPAEDAAIAARSAPAS